MIQHHIDKATELALKYLALGMKEIIPLIPKDYTKYMDYLSNEKYINIVVIFLALELIGCLIFGVNIGQFLIGISTDGSFIVKRIKALVRSIIGLFTTPLLIFDIPALVGNKTLKELISASKIGYKSDSKKILGSYIFFPLFFSLLSLLPVFRKNSLRC